LHHHREKVCLVQVADGQGHAWLIDPLARPDLAPLARIVADPGVVKVFHGADYDVVTMKRDFGFVFANIFDTMIAARFLGLPAVGLQAIARADLGVELSKDSQRDDWSVRPLTPRQETYALADVQHLHVLHGRLSARLAERGRTSWVQEECEAVAALPPSRRRQSDDFMGIKGARRLAPRPLAALRELYAWRESVAERTDVPVFRILGNDPLLALAQALPRDQRALEALRDQSAELRPVPVRLLRAHGPALLEAIGRALALPEGELPRFPPPPPRPQVDEPTRRRGELLKAWRTKKAAALAVDVSVVLPQRLLDKVAEAAPREVAGLAHIEGLRRWRVAEFGAELMAVMAQR
ncbi:MAG TPA: HRDC domain-containing protein, partial [Vicinamibacteria bacterium]|nr:HRDC domain-containing protein [Vicinamibacteria bacterium]